MYAYIYTFMYAYIYICFSRTVLKNQSGTPETAELWPDPSAAAGLHPHITLSLLFCVSTRMSFFRKTYF